MSAAMKSPLTVISQLHRITRNSFRLPNLTSAATSYGRHSRFHTHESRASRSKTSFKPIQNTIVKDDPVYNENHVKSQELQAIVNAAIAHAMQGGGQKAIDRHVLKNKKMLVYDRIKSLVDDFDDFLEICPLAGMKMEYGDIAKAGVIAGIAQIQGTYCMVIANDATVKGGTMYPIGVTKQLRAQDIAYQNKLPVVYIVDSGGAFLPLQADIFIRGGRVFYNEAMLSAESVPQLAIVCGSCTAGGAYVPTMSQEAIIVDRIGTIFLAGPPLIKAALGEVTSPEDLGGATMHCTTSGCTDYFAATEEEAYEMGRDIVATFNMDTQQTVHNDLVKEPLYDPSELSGVIPSKDQHTMDLYQVIARVVDGSGFQEFKKMYGTTIITGFARIEGSLVGIVASNGGLTAEAALKACHFVQLCSHRALPIVFMQNSSPEDDQLTAVEDAVKQGVRLRAEASLMSVIASSQVPKITLIVGNSFGVSNYLLCGRSFDPNFLFMWPNARISIAETDTLVNTVIEDAFGKEVDSSDETFQKFNGTVVKRLHDSSTALFSTSRCWDDGVILPQDTRKVLGQCLKILRQPKPQPSAQQAVLRL